MRPRTDKREGQRKAASIHVNNGLESFPSGQVPKLPTLDDHGAENGKIGLQDQAQHAFDVAEGEHSIEDRYGAYGKWSPHVHRGVLLLQYLETKRDHQSLGCIR